MRERTRENSDVKELLQLCLSTSLKDKPVTSNFIYDGRHHTAKESGPIGLSLMVEVAKLWMDHTIKSAIELAATKNINIPRNNHVYMDDSFGILKQNATNTAHLEFQKCLDAVHPRLRFTHEQEKDKQLPFLDVMITRLPNGQLSTKVYRKPSHTGLAIHPRSCQNPLTWIGTFKGALCRAYRLCSSPALIQDEINYIIKNYEENGYNRHQLQKIAGEYKPNSPQNNPLPPPSPPPPLPSSTLDSIDQPTHVLSSSPIANRLRSSSRQ